MLSSFGSLIKI